ncbi:MAG: sulfatase-like hydrolase/transferase [Verrucomicrobiota bacterium]
MKQTSELFTSVRWFAAGVTALAILSPSIPSSNAAAPGKQPNFVLILGEGAGWTSTSVQMDDRNPASKGTGIKTPNLKRLAAAGMRFSDGYAASPKLRRG